MQSPCTQSIKVLHGNEASFTQSAAGEYGKGGKGNEVETGNREWKRKLEIGIGNSTVYCGIWE